MDNFTMGVNFSNNYQSNPVDAKLAADQIAKLPVTIAKTFNYVGRDKQFIDAVAQSHPELKLAVGTTNADLAIFAQGNTKALMDAIRPIKNSVSMVCVGNEPLGSWYNGQFDKVLVGAVANVARALDSEGINAAVAVPQNFEFMGESYPPSAGIIQAKYKEIIAGTCDVFAKSGGYFMVNIYPFLTRKDHPNDVQLPYCMFDAAPNYWVYDGKYEYKNIFDAMLDALLVALGKINHGDLKIIVGECGWPTDGGLDANITNAQKFNQNMINHCKLGYGTPRQPNRKIPCFVFEMYNEDTKPTDAGPFERHWGVYNIQAVEKYKLNW
jgi:Glycosyl hydrolases family 17